LGDFAQFWNAVELSVKVQYVLAVEALAGFDELEIRLLELSDLDNMVLGALEEFMFLPEFGVDLQVRIPQRRLEFAGGCVLEVGEDKGLAGGAVPVER
jgi:hypothetical protein